MGQNRRAPEGIGLGGPPDQVTSLVPAPDPSRRAVACLRASKANHGGQNWSASGLTLPLAPLVPLPQHFVGQLQRVEGFGGVIVARSDIGVDLFGLGAEGFFHRFKISC